MAFCRVFPLHPRRSKKLIFFFQYQRRVIKQIYQEWKERRKARIEECRNWMPEPYRITPEELEEINQLLEEMDKMEQ